MSVPNRDIALFYDSVILFRRFVISFRRFVIPWFTDCPSSVWFCSFVKAQRIILGAIYDVNTFLPIFYKQSRTLNRLIRVNEQLDDKRINFNRDIRVLDLEILIYLSG